MVTIITGFLASIAHVVTGPDHLAAVTPLAIDSRKRSWQIGLWWGVGHTTGMLLIGLLFASFRELIPVEVISEHSEVVIGLLLILIGGWAVLRTFLRHSHGRIAHPHVHTKPVVFAHIHAHTHENSPGHSHDHTGNIRQNSLTAIFIGIIHGFAGFSHLLALLPSLAFPSRTDTFIYLFSFAAGTILSMVLYSLIMGLLAARTEKSEHPVFLKWFTYAGGLLAIGIGLWWLAISFKLV